MMMENPQTTSERFLNQKHIGPHMWENTTPADSFSAINIPYSKRWDSL